MQGMPMRFGLQLQLYKTIVGPSLLKVDGSLCSNSDKKSLRASRGRSQGQCISTDCSQGSAASC